MFFPMEKLDVALVKILPPSHGEFPHLGRLAENGGNNQQLFWRRTAFVKTNVNHDDPILIIPPRREHFFSLHLSFPGSQMLHFP
jgi:hypothetical protein